MTVTRIYLITPRHAQRPAPPVVRRLIRATHPAAALRHIAASEYSVAVAGQDDLISCLGEGVKVEQAGFGSPARDSARQWLTWTGSDGRATETVSNDALGKKRAT